MIVIREIWIMIRIREFGLRLELGYLIMIGIREIWIVTGIRELDSDSVRSISKTRDCRCVTIELLASNVV